MCLDVANSVDGRVLEVPLDYLATYADLVDWAMRAGGLSAAEAGELLTRADAEPEAARDELVRARTLRESVFALFYGHATDGVADAGHLAAVQEAYTDALRHGRLDARRRRSALDVGTRPAATPLAGRAVGDRAGDERLARSGQGVRVAGRLPVPVRRHVEERQPPVVQHDRLRQPGEVEAPHRAAPRGSHRSPLNRSVA